MPAARQRCTWRVLQRKCAASSAGVSIAVAAAGYTGGLSWACWRAWGASANRLAGPAPLRAAAAPGAALARPTRARPCTPPLPLGRTGWRRRIDARADGRHGTMDLRELDDAQRPDLGELGVAPGESRALGGPAASVLRIVEPLRARLASARERDRPTPGATRPDLEAGDRVHAPIFPQSKRSASRRGTSVRSSNAYPWPWARLHDANGPKRRAQLSHHRRRGRLRC
jgi:hypothetical protein